MRFLRIHLESAGYKAYIVAQLVAAIMLAQIFTAPVVCADDALFAEARSYIDSGRPDKAFTLLQPQESALAGEDEYDFLLGVAALESGKPNLAVFALERSVTSNPRFGGARIELARAYFKLGELQQAKTEFMSVLSLSPPTKVKRVAQGYLDAIDKLMRPRTTDIDAYFELGLSNDSNSNAATGSNSFIGITLSDNSKAKPSGAADAAIGVQVKRSLTSRLALIAGSDVSHRAYDKASFVDTTASQGRLGITHTTMKRSFGLVLNVQQIEVDHALNNRGIHLTTNSAYAFSERMKTNAFLRYGAVRYAESFHIKDVDQLMLGLQILRATQSNIVANMAVIAGRDEAVQPTISPYGRDYYGFKLTGATHGPLKTDLFSSVGLLDSSYNGKFFGLDRHDKQVDFTVGAIMSPHKQWSIKPQVSFVSNHSDVALYDYERLNTSVTIRHFFL